MSIKLSFVAFLFLFCCGTAGAESPQEIAARVQMKYQPIKSMKVSFSQVYETNGIQQEESGILWVLKPGCMRWEYNLPEKKLFLVDGKNSYFYVPADNQVSTRTLTKDDVRYTAFGFLLDQSRLDRDFQIELIPPEGHILKDLKVLKLLPKHSMENVEFLLLGLQPETLELSVILVQELSGARNTFSFSHPEKNPILKPDLFKFKAPKGAEIVSIELNP